MAVSMLEEARGQAGGENLGRQAGKRAGRRQESRQRAVLRGAVPDAHRWQLAHQLCLLRFYLRRSLLGPC